MRLPLYTAAPQAEIGWEEPTPLDPACTRCDLHTKAKTVCVKPEGVAGGLYVVAEAPDNMADTTGRPFTAAAGRFVRALLAKHWKGPVAFDHGVRCYAGADEVTDKHTAACRPYGAQVLAAVRPTRIVTLGGMAAQALLGRKPAVHALRRGYGWWIDDALFPKPEAWVPVYFLQAPLLALRNRHLARDFEDDLQWALAAPRPTPRAWKATTFLVRTAADAQLAVAALRAADWFSFDTETSGLMFDGDFRIEMLTCYGAGLRDGFSWDRAALEDPALRAPLRALLDDKAARKVGQNLKYDALAVLEEPLLRVRLAEDMHLDTRLTRKLLEGDVDASLDTAAETVGMGGHKHEAKAALQGIKTDLAKLAAEPYLAPLKPTPTGKVKVRAPYAPKALSRAAVDQRVLTNIWDERAEPMTYAYRYLPHGICARYNARDALSTALLAEDHLPRIAAAPNLTRAWEGVMKPAMRVLTRMEAKGVLADRAALTQLELMLAAKLKVLELRMQRYGTINFNSPAQLQVLLYEKLGLKPTKRTASGWSTDEEALSALAGHHPIIGDILEHRRLSTLHGMYAKGMLARIRADGRIHTSFLLDGAGTGRMSSQGPNLQNIPRPEDDAGNTEGKLVRDAFVVPHGYVLIEADYKQLELFTAAAESGDPVMTAMFRSGLDFHTQTGRMIAPMAWKIPHAQWDAMDEKAQAPYRSSAKTSNFQIHYDREPAYLLAKKIGVSVEDAEKLVGSIKGQFKVLVRAMDAALAEGRRDGGVLVRFDGEPANWRPLPGLGAQGDDKHAKAVRRNAENACWNTKIQGRSAHYMTASLAPMQDAFDDHLVRAELVLTVHDSAMVECHEDDVEETIALMRQVMTRYKNGGLPLQVDFKVGTAWGSLAKHK